MQKRAVFLFCFLTAYIAVTAQVFDDFFLSKALRINYIHSGNKTEDKIDIKSFQMNKIWSGSLVNLIDTFDYGSNKIEVYDLNTNQLIYSRTYSCLFDEYRTTEKGEKKRKAFKETVLCPFPKNEVEVKFFTRTPSSDFSLCKSVIIDPKTIKVTSPETVYSVVNMHIGNESFHHAYDILIVPEGYTVADSSRLRRDLLRCKNAILNCRPFSEFLSKINIRAVLAHSPESGVSNEVKGKKVKTLLGSSFYSLDLERYLMLDHVWALHDVCSNAPYDNIVILCNTKKYGGGGIYNWYAVVSDNPLFDYVLVHELGHSIAGLADEYFTSEVTVQNYYPLDKEPREPNITSLVNFEQKWKNMLDADTPIPTPARKQNKDRLGVYEGAGYCSKGLYRPYISCSMKDADYDNFCPVCLKGFEDIFNFYSE
jgi:hypothetical protein